MSPQQIENTEKSRRRVTYKENGGCTAGTSSHLMKPMPWHQKAFWVAGKGYNFETSTGEKMVELHVDDIPEVNIFDNKTENKLRTKIEGCIFGGNLSVRKDSTEKALLAFGHDECIFRQFIFTGTAWIGVKGELPIIPKDEGFGIMVPAFQSREFGFGFKLTSEDLKFINDYRSSH